ncbi:unnamed protein product [Agarophyton chilense]
MVRPDVAPDHEPERILEPHEGGQQSAPMVPVRPVKSHRDDPNGRSDNSSSDDVGRGLRKKGGRADCNSDSDRHSRARKSRRRRQKRRLSDSDTDSDRSDSSDVVSRTDSDSDSDRSARKRRSDRYRPRSETSAPRRIKPLNELFTKVVEYRTYRLNDRSRKYKSKVARGIARYQKKFNVQMKEHSFSGADAISFLNFLQRFKTACNHNGLSERAALWCFQFYLTGSAHALIQSRLFGETGAVDVRRCKMLRTYSEVVNFLLTTYATDEVIADAY